jgi:hypothetical protein
MGIKFTPPLHEAEKRARVRVVGRSKEGLVDAIIKADEQKAEEAGFRISWLRPLAREAHGSARRNSR